MKLFRLHSHIEVSSPEDVAKMEDDFAAAIHGRGPEFKFYQVLFKTYLFNHSIFILFITK